MPENPGLIFISAAISLREHVKQPPGHFHFSGSYYSERLID
jgi:hypothetical protein